MEFFKIKQVSDDNKKIDRMPYKLTDSEREIVKEAIGLDDDELDCYETYFCENGEICVTTPPVNWKVMAGCEWMVNLSDKTARVTRMS